MKKILLFTLPLLIGACTPVVNPFPPEARLYSLTSGQELTGPKAAREAAVYGTVETQLFDSPQAYCFVRFKASHYQLEVVNAPGQQADSTSALCLKHGAVAGINGSYFDMGELTPVTYVKDDGFEVGSTTPGEFFRTNGSVLLDIDSFAIDATEPDTTWTGGEGWREALASGPILIDEGQTVVYEEGIPHWRGFYNYRHPRSLIGTDAQGYVWLVVVDGRFDGQAEGMTLAELTSLAQTLGLTDALNLDGGGSSTLWALPAGVLNHPCDNGAFDAVGQRIIPNAIIVKPL
jgi:exopolysaccharide biosynthesis protein